MYRILAVAVSLLVLISGLQGQTNLSPQSTTTGSSQALTLAAQSLQALTGGNAVSDATLFGNATQLNADTNAGSITLKARGYSQARLDATALHDVKSLDSNGVGQGQWIGAEGTAHVAALHNTWTDAAWFFPALSSLSATTRPDLVTTYVGLETLNNRSVQHVRFFRNIVGQTPTIATQIAQLSTVDIYLDATSLLPTAIRFQTHPDNDFSVNFPVEVDYSDYRNVNGVQVPFRIQKYVNSNLTFDVAVSSVSINTGLTDSDFSIQ